MPKTRLAAAAAGAVLVLFASSAWAADDFYKGRTISVLIGYSVGGGYDLYARVLARHFGRHIPGGPSVVPQNMPGAGSLKAATYLYSVAPKDGTVIGTFGRSIPVAPLFGEAKFDGTKFSWLGSVTSETSLCITWHASPIKVWDDMLKHDFTMAGEGAGSDPDVFALVLKNIFGAHLKLITGFPGTNDATLAMERGEVDGSCGISYSTITGRHPQWLKEQQIHMIVQAALVKAKELPDVPLLLDEAKTQEQRQMLKLIVASQAMARPFAAPPGIPDDRKKILRAAFDATMKDAEFLAEAAKANIEVNPMDGTAVDELLGEVYASPKDVIAKASRATTN